MLKYMEEEQLPKKRKSVVDEPFSALEGFSLPRAFLWDEDARLRRRGKPSSGRRFVVPKRRTLSLRDRLREKDEQSKEEDRIHRR